MTGIGVLGDLHGHLQLGLSMFARWQHTLGIAHEAVFLAGDVGSFTTDAQLDSTTRRHNKTNPCETEFMSQWATNPPAPWLERIFRPIKNDGLGLTAPVVMIHGNHEGFAHLATLIPSTRPKMPVSINSLPTVDAGGWIRYLPSGWIVRTPITGQLVGGIGGIQPGQREADYYEMADIDEEAVLNLLDGPKLDLLITHQGPTGIQGLDHGSELLQTLLDAEQARWWFHGHSIHEPTITKIGTTTIVPLGDIAFQGKGAHEGEPGDNGWASLARADDGTEKITRERPSFWRDYRRKRWLEHPDGRLVYPDLLSAKLAW